MDMPFTLTPPSTPKGPNRFYRFEFEESFMINSLSLYSDSLNNAINQVSLILGEFFMDHVQSINVFD